MSSKLHLNTECRSLLVLLEKISRDPHDDEFYRQPDSSTVFPLASRLEDEILRNCLRNRAPNENLCMKRNESSMWRIAIRNIPSSKFDQRIVTNDDTEFSMAFYPANVRPRNTISKMQFPLTINRSLLLTFT